MPQPTCPKCGDSSAHLVENLSNGSALNFYRCRCSQLWTLNKDGSGRPEPVMAPRYDEDEIDEMEDEEKGAR